MNSAKKIVLVSRRGYDPSHDDLLRILIARRIELFCAVGRQCELWEENIDELVVEPAGESQWNGNTTSHPGETVAEVLEFAKNFHIDSPSEVEIIKV